MSTTNTMNNNTMNGYVTINKDTHEIVGVEQ